MFRWHARGLIPASTPVSFWRLDESSDAPDCWRCCQRRAFLFQRCFSGSRQSVAENPSHVGCIERAPQFNSHSVILVTGPGHCVYHT